MLVAVLVLFYVLVMAFAFGIGCAWMDEQASSLACICAGVTTAVAVVLWPLTIVVLVVYRILRYMFDLGYKVL